jgi:hypothetical protein
LLDLILTDDAKEKCGKEKIRSIEKHFHVMLLRVCKIFMELKGDNCESLVSDIHIKEGDGEADCTKGMDDKTKVDLAFVFFAFNCINLRPFYNGANIVALAKIIGNYKASLLNASEIFKNIECDGKNALNLIDDFKDKRNSVWYHDIPYSQTKDSTYVVHGFNEVLFTERISECSGKYIVASRFNICESSLNNDFRNINHTKKQYGVIKFFSRFLPEKYFSKYNLTNIIDEDYKGYVCEKDKEMYGWKHVLEEKKAEYVIFAYCQLEQELNNKEGDAKEGEDAQKGKAGYFRRSSTVSVDSIRRMLKSTQLTDISVEIMITNMKLTLNPVCLVDDNSEIWCLPTFKTPSSYKVNPITIIMPYKLFYEQIILQLLSKEAYEKVFEENVKDTAKDTAAAFRKFYSNR